VCEFQVGDLLLVDLLTQKVITKVTTDIQVNELTLIQDDDQMNTYLLVRMKNRYSETCKIRTPLEQVKSVPNSEVSSFQGAICTENISLGPDEVSLFYRMSSFCRIAIHRFHCNILSIHCMRVCVRLCAFLHYTVLLILVLNLK
jgi:hypothetical protein